MEAGSEWRLSPDDGIPCGEGPLRTPLPGRLQPSLGSVPPAAWLPALINFPQLLKLRLVVAAIGEKDRRGWWNSELLCDSGRFLFEQNFPRSAPFAQARAAFRVAQLACDEALGIKRSTTGTHICHLFRLPPEVEDAFENERDRWLDQAPAWESTFEGVFALSSDRWPQVLGELGGLDGALIAWGASQKPQTAKALHLADARQLGPDELLRLAAGFACGRAGTLVVPYLQLAA